MTEPSNQFRIAVSNCGIGAAPHMTSQRDHAAETYFAIVALLESTITSIASRPELEKLRDKLEQEMADIMQKSEKAA